MILTLILALAFPFAGLAQDVGEPPRAPSVPSTTQINPRGADIVEPMAVYQISERRGEAPDTVYLGIAKIPDPRLGQEGAFVQRDQTTGTMIRISDAVIIDDGGLRRTVEFDPRAAREHLVFVPGPHDIVVSRQGVAPVRSWSGREVVFDIAELHAAAKVNPLTGATSSGLDASPRTALMRMESTYRGGEAVPLAVAIIPRERPVTIRPIHIVQRDTTILVAPAITYVFASPPPAPRMVSVIATLESGYGRRHAFAGIPAMRGAFDTNGWADIFYVDGAVRLERETHRWRAHVFGTSSLANTDVTAIPHHQVALHADLRFEYGRATYVAVQAGGRMADKPHQEFDWDSADYAGSLLVGPGRRTVDGRGIQTSRIDLLAGLRMGENRMIEVYQAGVRARGMGPELILSGHLGGMQFFGMEAHLRGEAQGYTIAGRGARDAGFRERGLRLMGDLSIGQEMGGMFVYMAARGMLRRERAWYPGGDHYFLDDGLLAPAAGVEMRL